MEVRLSSSKAGSFAPTSNKAKEWIPVNIYHVACLLGRFAAAYLLVWTLQLICRRNWRVAYQFTRSWRGMVVVLAIFVLGIAISASKDRVA